jgi:hypothetical protein
VRGRVLVAVVGAVLALAACDPGAVPQDPEEADVDIEVQPDGDVVTYVVLAFEREDRLPELAGRLGPAIGGEGRVGSRWGQDAVVVRRAEVFAPARAADVQVALSPDALEALAESGIERVDVGVDAPQVAGVDVVTTATPEPDDGTWFSGLPVDGEAFTAEVRMTADVGRGWRTMVVAPLTWIATAVAVVAAVAGRFRRHRAWVAAPAALALAGSVALVGDGWYQAQDDLVLAGVLPSRPTAAVWTVGALATFGAVVVAAGLLVGVVVAAVQGSRWAR